MHLNSWEYEIITPVFSITNPEGKYKSFLSNVSDKACITSTCVYCIVNILKISITSINSSKNAKKYNAFLINTQLCSFCFLILLSSLSETQVKLTKIKASPKRDLISHSLYHNNGYLSRQPAVHPVKPVPVGTVDGFDPLPADFAIFLKAQIHFLSDDLYLLQSQYIACLCCKCFLFQAG